MDNGALSPKVPPLIVLQSLVLLLLDVLLTLRLLPLIAPKLWLDMLQSLLALQLPLPISRNVKTIARHALQTQLPLALLLKTDITLIIVMLPTLTGLSNPAQPDVENVLLLLLLLLQLKLNYVLKLLLATHGMQPIKRVLFALLDRDLQVEPLLLAQLVMLPSSALLALLLLGANPALLAMSTLPLLVFVQSSPELLMLPAFLLTMLLIPPVILVTLPKTEN